METLLGTLIWGGLLLLLLWWLGGRVAPAPTDRDERSSTWTSRASSPTAPAAPSARAPRSVEERQRETEALVDGLVIGHYLTRDHERRRAAERLEELERERGRAFEAEGVDADGFDELDAYDDPQGFAFDGWGEEDELDDDGW